MSAAIILLFLYNEGSATIASNVFSSVVIDRNFIIHIHNNIIALARAEKENAKI